MYEELFLQKALNEIESLREENEQLKRKLLLFEQLIKDLEKILKGEKIEERRIRKVFRPKGV